MDFLTASQDFDLDGAEVGLGERLEVHKVLEQRLDLDVGEVDRLVLDLGLGVLVAAPMLSTSSGFSCLGSVQRLHRGEQDDVADGVCAGEEHDRAVDAHAHAARGGHAVFEGGEEILIEHFGLVVAAFALLDLLHEAFALVDGVVQLGIGVAHLRCGR